MVDTIISVFRVETKKERIGGWRQSTSSKKLSPARDLSVTRTTRRHDLLPRERNVQSAEKREKDATSKKEKSPAPLWYYVLAS